jgi:ABC-type ATPase involved in cell division/GNAT superfamily N-acetyltransferase
MSGFNIVNKSEIKRTPRVMQIESIFEVAPNPVSEVTYSVNLPLQEKGWNIGLIVGPSGAGKTTLAKALFGETLIKGHEWGEANSILDDFPREMGIKDISGILSRVGFSSPPSWLRPFHTLSNGEQFRVTLARAIAENVGKQFVIDEFTSVVDRTVAQIGSAAVSKAIRSTNSQMIAVGCHYDVIEWLQPDWIYQPHINSFEWRSLRRRPDIKLTIQRVNKAAWSIFKRHHYLDTHLHNAAQCFLALVNGAPVAFTAVLHFPHPVRSGWREHRTVCLPDYQGVGIGNALSDLVAGLFRATGKPYRSTTGNPAMKLYRLKSPNWKSIYLNKQNNGGQEKRSKSAGRALGKTVATNRLVSSFEYVGPVNKEDALKFQVI